MLPFLAEELCSILQVILNKFVKDSVMEEANTYEKLSHIDVFKKENILSAKQILEVGFAAKLLVHEAQKKKASILQVKDFQEGCIIFLQKVAWKLLEQWPLKYPVVRYRTSLYPSNIADTISSATATFNKLLQKAVTLKLKPPGPPPGVYDVIL